ncbi:MAG: sodium:proton antiporter [Polaromonas sp. 39-63-203]|jgi:NhaP-type Na+/H+ or K+/H+ antiporter|uniref:cation:proton antiporter n=1 Tax=Polaromonas sp. TaxID=1869339 RepID=UPI000BC86183|nr:cation:proton antiporter [Polaromonas sp.]OYY52359.1 MAG: sodium:proton antiporter [Polaromonas sp. 35-63-240]OYZ00548.1 MAG: sodium:proton antiporter [Polaromonas sp. 28-63-22]OYZ83741.1 MAG: sodium:proton antiporter [Polaromonas sp. 24-62-144]OZA96830.1 MAG: sodium:proton antiporter [Polaromonas sp. 39-63-203]HQS32138.1 cation:proton antiporter [Polaromonas sp.]
MNEPTTFTLACIIVGGLLIAKTLFGSFISRLPMSTAMLYLGVGMAIGPLGFGLVHFDALKNVALLERLTEIAVLISLFTTGLKLELPLKDARWRIPLQLATVSMVLTVAAIAAVGTLVMGLSLGASVLLGAILAPTDPVLASDVQVANPGDRDQLRFGLTGEGGLNDGTAFPFVMLGLGLLGVHKLGDMAWRWWTFDVLWAIAGGLGLGYGLGTLVGRAIIYLRVRHREALGSDEFIALGLIALTYGLALLSATYGFLAVFAAGLALRRIDPSPATPASASKAGLSPEDREATGTEAPAYMMREVQRFNVQLESFAEVGIVLTVGVLIATVRFRTEVLWFIPLLFLVIRPAAVGIGLIGTHVRGSQRRLMAWFGIRGIGSLYYLLYAVSHKIEPVLAQRLLSITVAVVVASVLAHGVSVTPLMRRYEARKKEAAKRSGRRRA